MKKKTTTKPKVNMLDETKKILNSFLPFPPQYDDLQFVSPDEVVAFDMGGIIRRTTAGKIAEAVANGKRINRQILPDLDPEKVLTGEVKAKIKSSFDNILNTPSKEPTDLPNYEQPTSYSFELKPTDVFNITVDGRELNMSGQTLKECFERTFEKEALQDQVDNLRQECQELTDWKKSALTVFKKWEAVEDFINGNTRIEELGRSIADLVLERLKGNVKQFTGKEVKNMKVVNEREPSPEEMVEGFLRQLEGRESYYPFVLEAINDRLLTQLERVASIASETSAVARKRFEEAVSILQRVSPPNKHH